MIMNMFTIKISKVIWKIYDDRKGKYMFLGVTLILKKKLKNLVISCQIDNTTNSVQNVNLTTECYIVTRWQSLYTSG